jgi:site-specific DNA-cytosine methylase
LLASRSNDDANEGKKKRRRRRLWFTARNKGNKDGNNTNEDILEKISALETIESQGADSATTSDETLSDEAETARDESNDAESDEIEEGGDESADATTPITAFDDRPSSGVEEKTEEDGGGDDSTPPSSLNNLIQAADLILGTDNKNEPTHQEEKIDDSPSVTSGETDSASLEPAEEDMALPTNKDTTGKESTDAPKKARRRFWIVGSRNGNQEVGSKNIEIDMNSITPTLPPLGTLKNVVVEPKDKNKQPKKKKKTSALKKVVNTVTLMVAILLYPIVADEVGDYITVGSDPSAGMRTSQELSPPSEPATGTESSGPTTFGESVAEGGKQSSTLAEKKDGSSSKNSEAWKDKLPPAPKQRVIATNNQKNAPTPSLDERRAMALSFISEVVDEVGPAVVRIDTESVSRDRVGYGGYNNNNPLGTNYIQQGQGSGLIFSRKGFILTNAHVVEGATKVKGEQQAAQQAPIEPKEFVNCRALLKE